MELLGVLTFTGGLIVFGLLAHRFGHDSRPSPGDQSFGPLAGRAGGMPHSVERGATRRLRLSTLTSRVPSLALRQMPDLARRPAPDPRIASKLSV